MKPFKKKPTLALALNNYGGLESPGGLQPCNTTEIAHSHRIAFYPILKTENEHCYFSFLFFLTMQEYTRF